MKKQEYTTDKQTGKKLWQRPWAYSESFIIAGTLILLGFVLEIILRDQQVPIPHRPYNLIILFGSIFMLVLVHIFARKTVIVKWLSSVPCAISAILSYAILVLLLGFIKQEGENQASWLQILGLNHLKNAWPFLFVEVYLFISLGLVVLRRSYPFTGKNLGFLLNHFGLWLTLMAASMGSGDLQRLEVHIFENGDFMNKGLKPGHEVYTLPFSLKLLDFKMETYNPKIMLSDTVSGVPEKQKGEAIPMIEKGNEYTLNKYSIQVLKLLPLSERIHGGYMASNEPMAATAAQVHVKNLVSGDTLTAWLCSGSRVMLPEYILLEKNLGLWLLPPEPRKYESLVVVKTKFGDIDTVTIEVNKPYHTRGWSFYQLSYDEKLGPASKLSIIEAVYDPWIKLVYLGIAFMLAGAAYLFWLGRGIRSDTGEEVKK
jgi:cytochrome c biogenesis factor